MTATLYIDPGASGGFAWRDHDGIVQAEPMPEGMTAQVDWLGHWRNQHIGCPACMEKVGTHMKGNAASASATFAGHCDGLRYAMYALGIPQLREPTSRQWQKAVGVPVEPPIAKHITGKAREKELAARKRRRKAWVQEHVQRLFPHLRVTLKTADALGMLAAGEGI